MEITKITDKNRNEINDFIKKLKLITTNDNLNAIKFYQKRGFDMTFIYVNAVEAARKIKPSIPEKGDYDIPIRHEIEFEKLI